MKFPCKTALTASALVTILPVAQAAVEYNGLEFSSNVALTSDYVWRGMTLTDESTAIQGGFDLEHNSGFFLGVWGSNIKNLEDNTIAPEDRADVEIDLYAGYGGELDNGLSYSINVLRYLYPGASSDLDYDYHEFSLGLGYSLPQGTELGLAYDYAPDFGGAGKAHHYTFNIGHSLNNGLGFGVHIGEQYIEDNDNDYAYYGASLSYTIADFEASINYSDTDKDKATSGKDADGRVFFTLSKSF